MRASAATAEAALRAAASAAAAQHAPVAVAATTGKRKRKAPRDADEFATPLELLYELAARRGATLRFDELPAPAGLFSARARLSDDSDADAGAAAAAAAAAALLSGAPLATPLLEAPTKKSARALAAEAHLALLAADARFACDDLVRSWRRRFSRDPADALARCAIAAPPSEATTAALAPHERCLQRRRELQTRLDARRRCADVGLPREAVAELLSRHRSAATKFPPELLARVARIAVLRGDELAADEPGGRDQDRVHPEQWSCCAILDDGAAVIFSLKKLSCAADSSEAF